MKISNVLMKVRVTQWLSSGGMEWAKRVQVPLSLLMINILEIYIFLVMYKIVDWSEFSGPGRATSVVEIKPKILGNTVGIHYIL